MELTVYKTSGEETAKKVVLEDTVFGVEPNDHAIYLDVKQYLANARQGTHKSKQRNEVAGSTRKLKRQKGTGGARSGSILSPLFPGGGRVFGPVPRDYSFKLNKKLKQLARRSALTYKAQNAAITVVDSLEMQPKTKEFIAAAKNLGIAEKKTLVVLCGDMNNAGVILAARNLPNVKVIQAQNINTYDVMNAAHLLVGGEGAVAVMQQVCGIQ